MVRINAVLPEGLLEQLDKIARDSKKSRSMLLREATKMLIEEYRKRYEETQRKAKIKRAITVQNSLRKNPGSGMVLLKYESGEKRNHEEVCRRSNHMINKMI